jgi:branched-chain amino acid transport system permease protein
MSNSNESGFRRNRTAEEQRQLVLEKLNPLTMPLRYQLGLLGLLAIALVPTQLYPNELGQFTNLLYLIMFAMSWDVVSGYTGQLSFGHAFFFALGGYSSAILNLQHGMSPGLSIPIGMVVAAIGGVAVGLPALRLRGPYLSLVTLIVPIILAKFFILFNNGFTPFGLQLAPEGFGGQTGPGIPDSLFGGQSALFSTQTIADLLPLPEAYTSLQVGALAEYYFSFALLCLVAAVLVAVTRSSAGDVLTAIREDEDAVAAAGLNPAKFKLFAFVLSAAVGGLAGAALVHTSVNSPSPASLLGGIPGGATGSPIQVSINVIIMSILGGTGTIVGAAVGAVFFGASTAVISGIDATVPVLGVTVSNLKPLPLLTAAMVVLVFLPGGLVRFGIRAGRNVLAVSRGEEPEEPLFESFEDSVLGEIVAKYREDIEEITEGK